MPSNLDQPRHPALTSATIGIGLGAGTLLAVAFGWFATVPVFEEATRVSKEAATLAAENAKSRRVVEEYEAFAAEEAEIDRRFEEVVGQVPTEAEMETVLAGMGALADGTGATITEFKPGKSKPILPPAPPAPAGAKPEAAAPQVVLAALSEQPVHVEVRSDMSRLRTLIRKFAEHERLIAIRQFTIRQREATGDGDTLEASLEAVTFSKKVDAVAPVPPDAPQLAAAPAAQPRP